MNNNDGRTDDSWTDDRVCPYYKLTYEPKDSGELKNFTSDIKRIFTALGNPIGLFVLRFYGPVNPMGSCRVRSVYLTTRLLGWLSPLSG